MNRDWYTIHRITAIKLLITFVFITFPKEKENLKLHSPGIICYNCAYLKLFLFFLQK